MECKKAQNLLSCTCTYPTCSLKGICCECLKYHWSKQELPGCLFPPEIEKTYDRSLKTFIDVWASRLGYRLVKNNK